MRRSRSAATRRSRFAATTVRAAGVDYFGNPHDLRDHPAVACRAGPACAQRHRGASSATSRADDWTPAWEAVRDRAVADHSTEASGSAGILVRLALRPAAGRASRLCRRARSRPGRPILAGARELTHRIFTRVQVRPQGHHGRDRRGRGRSRKRRGVCQDFAHMQIACLRSLGPAGALRQRLPADPPAAGPGRGWSARTRRTPGCRSGAPAHGWVDLDPTNDVVPGREHVTVGWGRDYGDVSPVSGVMFGGGEHRRGACRWTSSPSADRRHASGPATDGLRPERVGHERSQPAPPVRARAPRSGSVRSGQPPRWVGMAEANLWNAGFAGPIHAMRSTGLAPATAPDRRPRGHWRRHRFWAIVCLPQTAAGAAARAAGRGRLPGMVIIGGGADPARSTGEQSQAMHGDGAAAGGAGRRAGPGRRHRAAACASTPAPPRRCRQLAISPSSPSRIDRDAMLDWAMTRRIGFSRIVSLGDSADVELGDISTIWRSTSRPAPS